MDILVFSLLAKLIRKILVPIVIVTSKPEWYCDGALFLYLPPQLKLTMDAVESSTVLLPRLPAAQCPVICFNAKCFTAPNLQTSKQSFILKQCQWSVLIPTAFYYKVQLPLDNRDPFIGQPFDLSIF